MVFGMVVTPLVLLVLGSLLLLLIGAEVLLGFRVLKIGRKRIKIHRWVGISILAVGVVHGFLGFVFALGWRIG